MQSDTSEEKWHQEFRHSLRKIVHPMFHTLRQHHASKKSSDDSGYAGVDRQYGQTEHEHNRGAELSLPRPQMLVQPGENPAHRSCAPFQNDQRKGNGENSREAQFQDVDAAA